MNNEMYESLHQMKSFINNTSSITPESIHSELNEYIELDLVLFIYLYFRLENELDLIKFEIDEQ